MKNILFLIILFNLMSINPSLAQTGDEVEGMFKLKCGICHTIGGGRLIGPDLANVRERYQEEWLVAFIRSSQAMINSGDPVATALYEEYNKLLMPDPMISDVEIKSILDYVMENSGSGVGTASVQVSTIEDATDKDLENGKRLFEGEKRFANGGPSCISCHNDLSDYFFSENSFSTKDVGASFSNLGEAGVTAILKSPPFPVMTQAFEGHALKDNEVHDLLVFLKNSGTRRTNKTQMSSGYMIYGVLGAFALIVLYGGLWYNRKNKSVNHLIYKRQIKSVN